MKLHEDDVRKFWSRVRRTDSCWLFSTSSGNARYPSFGVCQRGEGYFSGQLAAHRFSFLLHYGRLPKKPLVLCHICDIANCVRPDHLFVGTELENSHDFQAKFAADPTQWPKKYPSIFVTMTENESHALAYELYKARIGDVHEWARSLVLAASEEMRSNRTAKRTNRNNKGKQP